MPWLASSSWRCWRPRGTIDSRTREVARGTSIFGLRALCTGFGGVDRRGTGAVRGYGVANANASRFVLFGSTRCTLALRWGRGRCFAIGDRFTLERARSADCCCAAPAGVRNNHLRPLMEREGQARHFHQLLETAYAAAPNESPFDDLIYPIREEVPGYRATLRRLRVGPYRDAPDDHALQRLAKTKLADEFGISGLRARDDGLILFAAPHTRFSIDVSRAVAIHFRYGVLPNAVTATPPTDGVEFRVLVPTPAARESSGRASGVRCRERQASNRLRWRCRNRFLRDAHLRDTHGWTLRE